MGARGPAPTPSRILAARGSWRADLNPGEPRPEPGAPPCPKGFTDAEKAVWKRLCKTLADMGVMTKADWAPLERYCRFFVRWKQAEDFLAAKAAQHGSSVPYGCYPLFRNDDTPADTGAYAVPLAGGKFLVGYAQYPTVRQIDNLDKMLRAIEVQFGLTPSARTRIHAAEDVGPRLVETHDGPHPAAYFFPKA